MARLNVYLPDDLAEEAKRAGLNISAVTQEALKQCLASRSTDHWLDMLEAGTSSAQVSHGEVLAALDAARDEAATRHA